MKKKRFIPMDDVIVNGTLVVDTGETIHVDLESHREAMRRLHEETLKAEASEQVRKNRPKV